MTLSVHNVLQPQLPTDHVSNSSEILWYIGRAVKIIQDAANLVVLLFLNAVRDLNNYIEDLKDAMLNACYDVITKVNTSANSTKVDRPPPKSSKKLPPYAGLSATAESVAITYPSLVELQKGSVALQYFDHRAIAKDGNCLFAAISYSVYGTEDRHAELRRLCCEKLEIEEFGAQYLLDTPHSQEGLKDYYEGWCVRRAEESNPQARRQTRDLVIKMGQNVVQNELKSRLQQDPSSVDMYKAFMSQDKSHGGEVELATLAAQLKRSILVFRGRASGIEEKAEASLFGREYRDELPIVLYNMPGHYDAYIPRFGTSAA